MPGTAAARGVQVDGLQINKTHITGDELAPVARFVNLRYLNASKAWKLDDAGIRHFAGLSRLEHLDLYSTQVTDAGLVSLANLTSLQHLHLGGTHLRGSGLGALRGLRRLARLSVEHMRIGDAALAQIDCPGLSKLVVFGTRVTPEGVRAFRLRFPRCEVVVDCAIEKIAKNAAGARHLLTLLVRRVVTGHPLRAEDGDEAVVEVVSRLFPLGTQFERLKPGKPSSPPMVVDDEWGRDDLWASKPVVLLGLLPHDSQIRISFPGGSRIVVPWLAARGADRRRPAPKLLAN